MIFLKRCISQLEIVVPVGKRNKYNEREYGDIKEWTPLAHAAYIDNEQVFQMLLDAGAVLDVNEIFFEDNYYYGYSRLSEPVSEQSRKQDHRKRHKTDQKGYETARS